MVLSTWFTFHEENKQTNKQATTVINLLMVKLLSLPCVIQHGCFIKWDFRSHSEEKYILWLIIPCGEYWSSIPRTVLRQRGIDMAPSYQGLTGTKLVDLTPQLPQRNMTKVLLAYRHCPATINFLYVPFYSTQMHAVFSDCPQPNPIGSAQLLVGIFLFWLLFLNKIPAHIFPSGHKAQ